MSNDAHLAHLFTRTDFIYVRDARIELAPAAWEAAILPLNESRMRQASYHREKGCHRRYQKLYDDPPVLDAVGCVAMICISPSPGFTTP